MPAFWFEDDAVEVWSVNFAVTFMTLDMFTVQGPVPEQAPDQPEKVEPEASEAVKVTEVPEA